MQIQILPAELLCGQSMIEGWRGRTFSFFWKRFLASGDWYYIALDSLEFMKEQKKSMKKLTLYDVESWNALKWCCCMDGSTGSKGFEPIMLEKSHKCSCLTQFSGNLSSESAEIFWSMVISFIILTFEYLSESYIWETWLYCSTPGRQIG